MVLDILMHYLIACGVLAVLTIFVRLVVYLPFSESVDGVLGEDNGVWFIWYIRDGVEYRINKKVLLKNHCNNLVKLFSNKKTGKIIYKYSVHDWLRVSLLLLGLYFIVLCCDNIFVLLDGQYLIVNNFIMLVGSSVAVVISYGIVSRDCTVRCECSVDSVQIDDEHYRNVFTAKDKRNVFYRIEHRCWGELETVLWYNPNDLNQFCPDNQRFTIKRTLVGYGLVASLYCIVWLVMMLCFKIF